MRQIKELSLTKFRLNDCFSHLDMTSQILGYILVPEDQPVCEELVKMVEALDEVIKQSRANSHTRELAAASKAVEDTWRGARAQVRALQKHPVEAKRVAAEKASAIFEKYGDVSTMTQSDMNTSIKNLLQDLKLLTEEELTLLDLQVWIDQLDRDYTVFVTAYLAQSDEYGKREEGIVAERRLDAENAYYALVFRINAGAAYNGDEPYAEFIDKLNGLIDKMDILYASTSYNGGKKKEDDAPADPDLPAE